MNKETLPQTDNKSNEITLQEILPAIKVESLPMTPEQEAVWYKRKKEISQQENEALYNGIVKEFENNLLYCADEISFIKQTIDLVKDHIKNIEAIPVLNSNGLPKEKRRKPNRTQMLLPCYRKYIEYLENKLNGYKQPAATTDQPKTKAKAGTKDEAKLTVKQIALIYVYNGNQITRENATDIVVKHGYKSGEGLFQDYTSFSNVDNRKGKPHPYTKKKLENRINLLDSVLEHLNDKQAQRAKDEINILKSYLENDF